MRIAIFGGDSGIKTNQPVTLLLSIANLASDRSFSFYEWLGSKVDSAFQIGIVSPSGKNISPAPDPLLLGSGGFVLIGPNETYDHKILLTDRSRFDEIGFYTITAKRNIGSASQLCWMFSNPLRLQVISGEWKPDTTNAPPAGF